MKLKYYRSNSPLFRDLTLELTADNTITAKGHVIWYKQNTAVGVAYRAKGATAWTYAASAAKTDRDIEIVISSLSAGTTYEFALYLKRGTLYNYSSVKEATATFVDPTFDTPQASDVTSSGMTVTGAITYGGTPDAMGLEYKKADDQEWTSVESETKEVSATLSGLTPETLYKLRLFATIGEQTFYSDEAEQSTEAETQES